MILVAVVALWMKKRKLSSHYDIKKAKYLKACLRKSQKCSYFAYHSKGIREIFGYRRRLRWRVHLKLEGNKIEWNKEEERK